MHFFCPHFDSVLSSSFVERVMLCYVAAAKRNEHANYHAYGVRMDTSNLRICNADRYITERYRFCPDRIYSVKRRKEDLLRNLAE